MKLSFSKTGTARKLLSTAAVAVAFTALWQACNSGTTTGGDTAQITIQPSSQNLSAGSPLTLSVTVTGGANLKYKWVHTFNWEGDTRNDTLDDTLSTFTVSAAPFDSGSYKCVITHSGGTLVSSSATITVTASASIPFALTSKGIDEVRVTCGQCHNDPPYGSPGAVPTLVHSDFLIASKQRIIRLLFLGGGDSGTAFLNPIHVNGKTYEGSNMPAVGANNDYSDSTIAGILTYVRAMFNGATDIVTPAEVRVQRDSLRAHGHSDLPAN